jgi:hypothetical protein
VISREEILAEIRKFVAANNGTIPGSVFKVTSPIQENFGVGRAFFWEYGPLGGAAIAKGIDVVGMKDGKLFTLYVFIE